MFFPCSCQIVNWRFSVKKNQNKKNKLIPTSDGADWVGFTSRYLSQKDRIIKACCDNPWLPQIYGDPALWLRFSQPVDFKPKEPTPIPIPIVKGEWLECGVGCFLSYYGTTTDLVRFKKGVPQDEPVEFGSLTGKYLLICCFNLPMLSQASSAMYCRSLIAAYDELSRRGDPFEMVVVANLRTDVVYDLKAAFYHFYSAFSCLAIPFSDFETRDFIHSCMRVRVRCGVDLDLDSAILLNPDGIILQHRDWAFGHFLDYGSEWAPAFLPTTLDAIDKQDRLLRSRFDPMYPKYAIDNIVDEDRQVPLSLYRDILLCDPLDRLPRFDAETPDDFSTVLDLSRKYVGLYFFIDGEILEDIKAAHNHCLANNQQLEILLVPMPFYDEPESYFKQLDQALGSLKITSWFLFWLHPKSLRRLWRIFGHGYHVSGEKFVIIPPGCESGELCGREVLINLGVDQYPFTRTAILKQRLEYARSLTPIFSSSLFNNCQMIQNGQEFKSDQLQGKNVLLYLSWTERDRYSLMKKHYPKIKAMGWEVVLVLLDYTDRYWNKKCLYMETSMDTSMVGQKWPCFNLKEMPWPYMLLSAAAGPSIKKLFFPGVDKDTVYLFAVGKDGKIVSRDVKHRLDTDGVTESLFDDVLEADLRLVLASMQI